MGKNKGTEEDWNKKYARARRIINILGIAIGVGFIAAAIIIYFC